MQTTGLQDTENGGLQVTTNSKNTAIATGQIVVNSISHNSGIFIGSNNYITGWSSHNKINNAFGSAANSTISHCMNILLDNDIIDAPNESHQSITTQSGKSMAPANTHIQMSDIHVNSLNTNSTIAVGDTDQTGWSSHGKSNMGEGGTIGVNFSSNNQNIIWDNDIFDAPVNVHK